jgi:streptogramin lyase
MSAYLRPKVLLSLVLAVAALLLTLFGIAGAAGIPANETALNPEGQAWEVNLDSQGTLWVSDLAAGEIWSFNTASGARTIYHVGGAPSDARGDGAGLVWWADFDSGRLSRLSTSTLQVTIWEIPDSIGLYSTAIDGSGDVWVSDSYEPLLYKLDPDTNQICSYRVPDFALSEYLYADGQAIWFGDTGNQRIVRLQGSVFDWWDLPAGSYPQDVEPDGDGLVWWTDGVQMVTGRLDPIGDTITTFTPPATGTPAMLTLSAGRVWYSQRFPGQVVMLDPLAAKGDTADVTTGSHEVAPACKELLPLAPVTATATSGQASWTGQTYETVLDEKGWTIYNIPTQSAPWGIVAASKIWLVDQGRQVLGWLSPYFTVEKQVSVDGGATWAAADTATGPELLAGFAPQFRVVATNTTSTALVVDVSDPELPGLTANDVALPVGAADAVVAGPVTGVWAKGQQTNTAAVAATLTGGNDWSDSQSDDANYLGADPGYTIEKQVSVNGGATWFDADEPTGPELRKNGVLQFRVLASNTGNVGLILDVSDPELPGLAANDVPLAVGATDVVVAGPATGAWAEGQQTNTAAVDGSYTDDAGHSWTDSQSDDANYFGSTATNYPIYLPAIVKS